MRTYNDSEPSFQPPKPTLIEIFNISSEITSIKPLINFLQKNASKPIKVSNVEYWDQHSGKAKLLFPTKSMAIAVEQLSGISYYRQKLSIHIVNTSDIQMDTLMETPSPSLNEANQPKFDLNSIIKCWLLARYDQVSGYLNLSGIELDKDLLIIISRLPPSQCPAIEKVSLTVDYWTRFIFSTIREELPNLSSLNLANNSLLNLSTLKNLFQKRDSTRPKKQDRSLHRYSHDMGVQILDVFSNIRSLSLSDNSLSSVDEIISFISLIYSNPNSKLVELLISGNPAISSAYLNYFPPTPSVLFFLTFSLKFPKLSLLDRVNIEPYRQAIASKALIPSSFDSGLRDILTPFLHKLISAFDTRDHHTLSTLYSTHPETRISMYPLIFSELAISKATNSSIDISIVANIWSNIQKSLLFSVQVKDLFLLNPGEFGRPDPITYQQSPSKVYEFISQLPQLRHSLESMSVIVFNGRPLFFPAGEVQVIQVFLSGIFYEGSETTPRSFVRNMVIVPGHTTIDSPFNFSILFDDWYLASYVESSSNLDVVIDSQLGSDELRHLTPMKRAIVCEFSKTVKLTIPYALQCLEQNNWRVLDAQEAVRILKGKKKFPKEALLK